MPHLIETPFIRDNGLELTAAIHFDYYFPSQCIHWQDKTHGSIQIIHVLNQFTKKDVIDLSVTEQIQLRRRCWDYLESRLLLVTPNVIPLF